MMSAPLRSTSSPLVLIPPEKFLCLLCRYTPPLLQSRWSCQVRYPGQTLDLPPTMLLAATSCSAATVLHRSSYGVTLFLCRQSSSAQSLTTLVTTAVIDKIACVFLPTDHNACAGERARVCVPQVWLIANSASHFLRLHFTLLLLTRPRME